MKRRKRKKRRRRWTTGDGCVLKCKRSEQLLVANRRGEEKTRRQIRLRAMPAVGRPRLEPKSGQDLKMAKLAAVRAPPGVPTSELFSESNFSASHSSRAASATRVVHFASPNSRNKQFMRSLGCSLWLLASCLSAASGSGLPHLQQQHTAAGEISARRAAADDSTSFITDELSRPRTETSVARLQPHDDHDDHDDSGKQDEQSVFVPLAPISEQRQRRTRAATAPNATTTTTLQDQDQRATDPLAELNNLPAGSRLVVSPEGQQIELACDTRELTSLGELTTRNEREFIISGPNKTLRRLEAMDRDKDVRQRARTRPIQANNMNDNLDADQLTDRLVSLIFWYKDDDPAPIYTLDARPGTSKLTGGGGFGLLGSLSGAGTGSEQRLASMNKQLLGAAKHYERNRTDQDGTTTYDWRSRIIADEWPVIRLQLNGVRGSHSGDYKCRVDFRRARTIRRVIRLFVEVPLQSLSLTLSDNDNNSGDTNLVQTNRSDEISENSAQDQNHTKTVRLNQEQRAEFVCRTNEGKLLACANSITRPKIRPPVLPDQLTIISNQQSTHATPREGARPRPILSWLVSWPPSSPAPGPTEVDEFFVSSESQARLARLLNGSIAGAEGDDDDARIGRKHRESKWKGSSKDFGQTTALSSSSSGGTKLILNRLARSMLGLRVGCRARQPKLELPNEDETADSQRRRLWQPPSANHAHMVSQGANWAGTAAAAKLAPLELTKWLELELNLRPESVRISRLMDEQQTPTPGNKVTGPEVRTGGGGGGGEPRPGEKPAEEEVQKVSLDEREPITFVCTTRGARPPARLSWSWLGGGGGSSEPIGRLATSGGAPKIIDKTSTSDGEQESTSQVEFPHGLARQWHGRKLLCTATNEATGGTEAWQPPVAHLELDIRYKPIVQLIERAEIGGSQRQRRRRFECLYQANPPINQLVWLVNGRPLVATSRGELINKTNGHGFDQAEIKQVAAGRPGEKGGASIRKHNKLFRFESSEKFAPTDSAETESESDDDELMATVEHQNPRELSKKRSKFPEIATASNQLSAFVTIDELEEKETSEDGPMVELKCAAVNELGKQESEPLVWASETTDRAEPKCRIDERLATLRSQSTLNSPHDSLLGKLEVHSLERGWPSDDKFSCQLESNTSATRYAWSFVPFEQIPERASQWAEWPGQMGAESDQVELFSQSSELIGAAEKLLPPSSSSPRVAANLSSRSVRGLLLCKAQLAHSQEWWPRSGPCLTLVVSGAQMGDEKPPEATPSVVPSTEYCRIEPILVQGHAKGDWVAATPRRAPPSSDEEKRLVLAARNERLAISVDCSAAPGKESLIFELGVARRVANKPDDGSDSTTTRDAISRQQPSPPPPGQLDDLMLLDERSSATKKNKTIEHQLRAAKKLLFTESAERADTTTSATGQGNRRLALSDLIPSQDFVPRPRQSGANDNGDEQDEPTKRKESEGGGGAARKLEDKTRAANKPAMNASESARKLHQANGESAQPPSSEMSSSSGGATSSLNEQVELLNELVFTLRASDLVRTSEPRAIYGSELRLAKRAPAAAPTNAAAPPPRRTKSSQRGSSETGGGSPAAVSLSRSAELLQLLAGEQSATPTNDAEGRGWHNISQASRSRQLDLVEWGRRHEVGITMAAIGATVLLSGLTLTLIVLVLRRNQRNSPSPTDMTGDNNNNSSKSQATANGRSSQLPSELVLMRSGSRVSLASRQHRPATESPLSSECHNSSSQKTSDHLLNANIADHYRHKHLRDCYLTDDLTAAAATEFAASLAGSQVCLSSQVVDFLAPPAHQLRSQQSQRTSSSSSQCTTSYTLTNSRRPPRQVRLNLSPQSIGDLEDTQTTIVEHTDYLHHRHAHYLGSLPRGYLLSGAAPPPTTNCDTRNLLTLPDLQVAAHEPAQFCQHQQQQLIFEHQQQLAPTTDCSFEQSPSLMSALSDPTASLSQGHQQTCHLILEPNGQLQLADFDEEQQQHT